VAMADDKDTAPVGCSLRNEDAVINSEKFGTRELLTTSSETSSELYTLVNPS
jgi:hypothetical protein